VSADTDRIGLANGRGENEDELLSLGFVVVKMKFDSMNEFVDNETSGGLLLTWRSGSGN
jgi:hypothetical protein